MKKRKKKAPPARLLENNNLVALFPWLCATGIALLTWLVFSPSLQNDFTNWDDNYYVYSNPLVANNSMPIEEIFTQNVASNYHPLTILSLALNYRSSQLSPGAYHVWNLILHILNTVLIFFFIWLLTRRNLLMAAVVSLFFGIHPMHVESVAWISERKDVLYVFFFIAGLISYLSYSDSKKGGWYIATLLLFVLSCLSKGMAVVFPVILLLIDYLRNAQWKWKVFIEKIPFLLLSIGFGLIAIFAQQKDDAFTAVHSLKIYDRLLVACYGYLMYIVKFIYPVHLSAFYPYPESKNSLPLIFYLSPFILIGLAAIVYFFFRKNKAAIFGLLFYSISIVLVLQFVSVGGAIMADRYSYLSYIGLVFIAASLIDKVIREKTGILTRLKYPLLLAAVAYAVLFSYQTYAQTSVWRNGETLWTNVIKYYPRTLRAYELRGNYYQTANEDDKALADYTKAIEIYPQFLPVRVNRGIIYYKKRQFDSSLADYNYSVATDTTYFEGYFNRGIYYDNANPPKYELALADFKKSYQLRPNDHIICNAVGVTLLQLKKYEESIDFLSRAIKLSPTTPGYWLSRSYAENGIGKNTDAKADALTAQQLGLAVDTSYLNRLSK